MIKATNPATNAVVHFVIPTEKTSEMLDLLKAANADTKVFEVGKMPLNELPEEVQNQIKSTLKAYNRVNVTFEYGKFSVSAGCCIKSHYNYDHFACGEYKADEVYTKEERRQNYIESFGYAPAYI